jgi:two-component system cell cycle sensor histidine kinase/response regulator CckA
MITNRGTAVVKRILLVDDEGLLRDALRLLLMQVGYKVVEANNGAEALGLFARERFDLVMTDYEMPFLKGNELATRIRRMAPRQPILMMTGFGHSASEDNPVDAVISKPLDFERLRMLMEYLLNGVEGALSDGCLAGFDQSN